MAVVSPLSLILLLSVAETARLLMRVVLEMSKRESINDRFPECLLPRMMSDLLSNFLWERDSFKN